MIDTMSSYDLASSIEEYVQKNMVETNKVPRVQQFIQKILAAQQVVSHAPNPSEDTPSLEFSPMKNRHITPPSQSAFDEAGDTQIHSAFDAPFNLHVLVDYLYQGKTYHILIINNPKKRLLDNESFIKPVSWSFILASIETLPLALENHIKELAPTKDKDPQDYLIELGQKRSYSLRELYFLTPTRINKEGNLDTEFDQEIQEVFDSLTYVHKVFRYQMSGENYIVRVIHNPQKKKLSAHYATEGERFTIGWPHRCGIIIDRPAPQAFVDHLKELANRSYCKIENGTLFPLGQSHYPICDLFAKLVSN